MKRLHVLLAVLALVVAMAIGWLLGRASAPETPAARPEQPRQLIARPRDVVRVPAVGLFCSVRTETGRARVRCRREYQPRFQVVFERTRTSVGRVGEPGDPRVYRE